MLAAIISLFIFIDVMLFAVVDRYILSFIFLLGEMYGVYYFVPEIAQYVNGTSVSFAIYIALAYIGVGILVAALKWVLHTFKVARILKGLAETFKYDVNSDKYGSQIDNIFTQFLHYVSKEVGIANLIKHDYSVSLNSIKSKEVMDDLLTPKAMKSVDRIGFGIVQWPIVIISFVFEDVLSKLSTWVSSLFGTLFSRISKYMISNATAGINMEAASKS